MTIRACFSLAVLVANAVLLQALARQSQFSHVVKGRVVSSPGCASFGRGSSPDADSDPG